MAEGVVAMRNPMRGILVVGCCASIEEHIAKSRTARAGPITLRLTNDRLLRRTFTL